MAQPKIRQASATNRLLHWSLLKHYHEKSPGISEELQPDAMNPGFWTPNGVNLDAGLQQRIDALFATTPALKTVGFALVDLTKGRMQPKLAGNTNTADGAARNLLTEQVFAASLAKIAAMYAAFQLQYDLREMARKDPSLTTSNALISAVMHEWLPTQSDSEPIESLPFDLKIHGRLVKRKGQKVPLTFKDWNSAHPPLPDGSPNLKSIFDVSKMPGEIAFCKSADPMTEAYHALHANAIEALPFWERMLLMIDKSHNESARSCILDVGYLYIASSLMQSDLFRPERGGGLWLSGSYGGGPGWISSPVPQRGSSGLKYQSSSPAAAAALMTLLAQGRLVSSAASEQMKWMLSKTRNETYPNGGHCLIGSFVENSLTDAGNTVDEAYSKVGVAAGEISDVALIVR
ncbi:MAG TPA: hypothetical protein VMK12_32915, partial [Anaeromyxobacteraceae bacterium]|nr:hypothetical protein [Anaeromyxobacteraceae bacterium]